MLVFMQELAAKYWAEGPGNESCLMETARRYLLPEWTGFREALISKGVSVDVLPMTNHHNGGFIQDAGLPLRDRTGRRILISCPGPWSSQIARRLAERGIKIVTPPSEAQFEGGDAVILGRTVFFRASGGGLNAHGLAHVTRVAEHLGYCVCPVKVRPDNIHLTTGATLAGRLSNGRQAVLINPEWIDRAPFADAGFEVLEVPATDPRERWASNVWPLGDTTFVQAGCPQTSDVLRRAGRKIIELPWDEMNRACGHFTCCTLFWE